MIFAAGLGTRLRPLTDDRPKALVEVCGRTLLEHNILKLKAAGFERIVVNVHHFAEQVIAFLKARDNFGIDIRVSDERQQLLDTGGGIRQALSLFELDSPILIHNVDIISTIDVSALYDAHRGAATLAINQRKTSRYLMFDATRQLCGWTNVSTGDVRGEMGEKFAFAGIHVIGPELFPYLQSVDTPAFPIVPFYIDVCSKVSCQGIDVSANDWVDCGKVESLTRAAEIINHAACLYSATP